MQESTSCENTTTTITNTQKQVPTYLSTEVENYLKY